METRNLRKERTGVVTSNKMDKSITVAVKWKEKHPIYGKFVNKTKKYHAHDEKNGIGKSQILEKFYSAKGCKVVSLFLGQMSDPGDLIGIPHKNEETGHTEFML